MKPLLFTILTIGILSFRGNAQLFANQDKKIIKNNTTQIVLLKTYSDYLDKGLAIVHQGSDLTHSLKNGELGLHSLYYGSLLQVNSNIKKYPLAGQTAGIYAKMERLHSAVKENISGTDLLSAKEKQRLQMLLVNLMDAVEKDMEGLDNLLTDGKYQLTDDERIIRIDVVHKSVLVKYAALGSIEKRVNTIVTGRKEQKNNFEKLRQLYGNDKW